MPTVLLVENEPALLEAFRYSLEYCGYTVLSATSGQSAIRVCHRYAATIDLLVSDAMIPDITGFEVAAIVKSAHPDVVVILTSGLPRDTFPQRAIAHEFLEKPFAHRELLSAISRHAAISARLGAPREIWN